MNAPAVRLRRLDAAGPGFDAAFEELRVLAAEDELETETVVRTILEDVRRRGDRALLDYTRRFDRLEAASVAELELPRARLEAALDEIDPADREALEFAAGRIRRYGERQRLEDWTFTDELGNRLGQRVTPLDRVGLYVPGGRAAYPSSVLMNAVPAKVAGVPELIMVVPAPGGTLNPLVLAAAAIAGVDRVFTLGGAQAIAALAYGTETVPAVDKIVGPGNRFVAAAKRLVFGRVGIDLIAGPSEVVIVADGRSHPEWAAFDLFAQAEHDELAQAILISPDAAFLDAVAAAVERLLPEQPRADIIARSLTRRGALIRVADLDQAVDLVNRIAPEHLELAVDDPQALLPRLRHAGAVFLGHWAAEVFGDYVAGPNHVLPTAGSARFASPLGVYDFQKRSTLLECSPGGASVLAEVAARLARGEGLHAHRRSAECRGDGRAQDP
ncbi:MAG: histidinol dehydrogenase [Gammaproteobacteria bacterium]|nr:MAG: histidinol dehydrogenase [Gammaproteobacteria bacterium]